MARQQNEIGAKVVACHWGGCFVNFAIHRLQKLGEAEHKKVYTTRYVISVIF